MLFEKDNQSRLFLAPMAGITDWTFRTLMKNHGADVVISELISADGIFYGGQRTLDLMRMNPEVESPVGIQIFGSDTDKMVHAAKMAERLGADFVDINLGCPVKKVVKKGAGSALLKDPKKLHTMLKAITDAIDVPLTIKIRTGWDDSTKNAKDIVKVAAEAGVQLLSIHGRTRAQSYTGFADWDYIGEVAQDSPIPIVGNGDICDPQFAIKCLQDYPVHGIMIGRGALKNPFIFLEIHSELQRLSKLALVNDSGINPQTPLWNLPESSFASQMTNTETLITSYSYPDLITEQYELLKEAFLETRPHLIVILLRKFFAWYSGGYTNSSKFRKKLYEIKNADDIFMNSMDYFQSVDLSKRDDLKNFLMGGHG